MMISPEANFDILFLLSESKKQFDDLNYAEISMLNYLALLMSIYEGKKANEWGYFFNYNNYGGPYSNEIANELITLEQNGAICNNGKGFYCITDYNIVFAILSRLMKLERFSWRMKYIETSLAACMTKSLPKIFEAIKNEPELSTAEKLTRKTVLHNGEKDSLFKDFLTLKNLLGDVRNELLIPASLWLDYLTLYTKAGERCD